MLTGENFVVTGQGKIRFKVIVTIEKHRFGLPKTVSNHLKVHWEVTDGQFYFVDDLAQNNVFSYIGDDKVDSSINKLSKL